MTLIILFKLYTPGAMQGERELGFATGWHEKWMDTQTALCLYMYVMAKCLQFHLGEQGLLEDLRTTSALHIFRYAN